MEKKLAIGIEEQTCIGVMRGGGYPLAHGNCFSVQTDDRKYFRIVNFVLENLEEAIRRGINWPIKIRVIEGGIAIVHDERIPDHWYQSGFCEVCCPKSLLPVPQLMAHDRQIARGERVETERDVAIDWSKRPKL